MGDEIELISDGRGLAVIGDPAAVELFIQSEGLESKDLGLRRLRDLLPAAAQLAQLGIDSAANSGRWVQLTKESAAAVKQYGLMDSATPGVKHAMIGKPGEIKQWIQIAKAPGSLAANPAVLAGAAGIMAQLATQQQMAEITEYLERIDAKLDDVLRAQTNQVLARMDGVSLQIREAMTVRESVGHVSEITWSKLQASSSSIFETQGYALRQLTDLSDKLERQDKLDDIADTSEQAKKDVQQWLVVLGRCFELSDALAILELDRVFDASPDELDRHRLGLEAARSERLDVISRATGRLLERMAAASDLANSKVLMHPVRSPAVVEATNLVALDVGEFHQVLGIGMGVDELEKRRWSEAASETLDRVRDKGADGASTVRQLGAEGLGQARAVRDKLSGRLAARRNRSDDEGAEE